MYIIIFIIGLSIGITINFVIEKLAYRITKSKIKIVKFMPPIICCLSFEILFIRFGLTILFVRAIVLTIILIIISFIDIAYRVIPDFMIIITLVIGMAFSLIVKTSFVDTILGMICGGGILLLLALIPNVMGGGDIKLMFAIGAFLGLNRTLWALLLAFIISSIISIVLILFKIKGTKDYIPFAPFLALGSFASLLILT